MKTETKNFFIGCAIFIAIALVLGCFLPFYVARRTKDVTMKKANMCMACGLSWLAVFYMWISWSTFYQAQIYPYVTITPIIEPSAD